MKMNFIKNLFKKQVLGVDLGQRTLKGVKLKKGKHGRVVLTHHFFQDMAETSKNFPHIENQTEILKAAVEINHLATSPAAATIRDNQVSSFLFNLSPMTHQELVQAIPQEISEHANLNMDKYSCDYTFSRLPSPVPGMNMIRAYCTRKDVVFAQMEILRKAGLKAKSIESEMMAVVAMLDFNEYIKPDEVVVVFDLGESHITSGLIADGALSLTQTHEGAFGALNKSLQKECNLSYEEAEKMKVGYNVLATSDGLDPKDKIVDEGFTQIFKAIKSALDFYKECPESYGKIDRVLLMGGASQFTSAVKSFEIIFRIPATIVNPFRKIDIFSELDQESHEEISRLSPYMGIAVGLALTSLNEEGAA